MSETSAHDARRAADEAGAEARRLADETSRLERVARDAESEALRRDVVRQPAADDEEPEAPAPPG